MKRGIGGRPPQLKAQLLGERGVVADGVGAAFSFRSIAPDPAGFDSRSVFPARPRLAGTPLVYLIVAVQFSNREAGGQPAVGAAGRLG